MNGQGNRTTNVIAYWYQPDPSPWQSRILVVPLADVENAPDGARPREGSVFLVKFDRMFFPALILDIIKDSHLNRLRTRMYPDKREFKERLKRGELQTETLDLEPNYHDEDEPAPAIVPPESVVVKMEGIDFDRIDDNFMTPRNVSNVGSFANAQHQHHQSQSQDSLPATPGAAYFAASPPASCESFTRDAPSPGSQIPPTPDGRYGQDDFPLSVRPVTPYYTRSVNNSADGSHPGFEDEDQEQRDRENGSSDEASDEASDDAQNSPKEEDQRSQKIPLGNSSRLSETDGMTEDEDARSKTSDQSEDGQDMSSTRPLWDDLKGTSRTSTQVTETINGPSTSGAVRRQSSPFSQNGGTSHRHLPYPSLATRGRLSLKEVSLKPPSPIRHGSRLGQRVVPPPATGKTEAAHKSNHPPRASRTSNGQASPSTSALRSPNRPRESSPVPRRCRDLHHMYTNVQPAPSLQPRTFDPISRSSQQLTVQQRGSYYLMRQPTGGLRMIRRLEPPTPQINVPRSNFTTPSNTAPARYPGDFNHEARYGPFPPLGNHHGALPRPQLPLGRAPFGQASVQQIQQQVRPLPQPSPPTVSPQPPRGRAPFGQASVQQVQQQVCPLPQPPPPPVPPQPPRGRAPFGVASCEQVQQQVVQQRLPGMNQPVQLEEEGHDIIVGILRQARSQNQSTLSIAQRDLLQLARSEITAGNYLLRAQHYITEPFPPRSHDHHIIRINAWVERIRQRVDGPLPNIDAIVMRYVYPS
ncbi:hypothetical protein BV898_06370 [Hypsibius exemplaris]|uniref:Uncharacterized protein n=1 Tax=Hypsibius exemplaris TaxID=2072580 RepID=A0A1W0WWN7_HYPEX|nr:hypothetical protein BV898_06370 [Hypsibius exemplaris]